MAQDIADLRRARPSTSRSTTTSRQARPRRDGVAAPIVIFEGLHPMHDERVGGARPLRLPRHHRRRQVRVEGAARRSPSAARRWRSTAIDARKPGCGVRQAEGEADIVIQVLLSDLIDDPTGKFLKVKFIQKKALSTVSAPVRFFDKELEARVDAQRRQADDVGAGRQDRLVRRHVVRPAGVGRRDGRQGREPRGAHLRRVAPLRRRHQVLRRAHRADRQEQGGAGLENGTGLFQTLYPSRSARRTRRSPSRRARSSNTAHL